MGAGHQWPAAPGRRLPGTRARGAFPPAGDDGKRGGCGDGVMHGPAAERATSSSDKTGTSHHQAGPRHRLVATVPGTNPVAWGPARPAYMSPPAARVPGFFKF